MHKDQWFKNMVKKFVLGLSAMVLLNGCFSSKKEKKANIETVTQKTSTSAAKAPKADVPPYMAKGAKIYKQVCLTCHQANGGGVSGLNAPLAKADFVLGDKTRLLEIIFKGSEAGLKVNNSEYANLMPGYGMLGDEEIASVASYIRNSFGNKAEPVTIEEVASYRTAIKK
jgi:mono/diheme cytochrome c family protein